MSEVDPVIETARAELQAARAQLSGRRSGSDEPGAARDGARFPRSRTLQWLLSGTGITTSIAFGAMLLAPRSSAVHGLLRRLPLPAVARFVLARIAARHGRAH